MQQNKKFYTLADRTSVVDPHHFDVDPHRENRIWIQPLVNGFCEFISSVRFSLVYISDFLRGGINKKNIFNIYYLY